MKESNRRKHYYLGMNLDLLVDGEVSLKMIDYLKNIISQYPEKYREEW